MVVGIVTLWVAAAALVASSVHVLTPRLPLYRLKTIKLFNLAFSKGKLKATWRADVSLHNENYIKADIHNVHIDMYYPSWDGSLTQIGHVRDGRGQEEECNNERNYACVHNNAKQQPLWSLYPRRSFETTDDLSMTLFQLHPRTLGKLLWTALRGTLVVPTTAVAHIRSTGGAPLTIGMVCDNELQVWSQQVVGRDCAVHGMSTGWVNLEEEQVKLQKHAFQRHVKNNVSARRKETIMAKG